MVDFWFGDDLARLADDKAYGQSYGAKWFGVGPPDQAFVGTQDASKELIQRAARCGESRPKQEVVKALLVANLCRATPEWDLLTMLDGSHDHRMVSDLCCVIAD